VLKGTSLPYVSPRNWAVPVLCEDYLRAEGQRTCLMQAHVTGLYLYSVRIS
jgi:hypothetical protein